MYETDRGDLPREFETIYPTYISDKRTLLCPEWSAYITTLPAEKQKKYEAYLTRYTYIPEEVQFWQQLPHEAGDPESLNWGWETLYAKGGEHLALVVCQYHDPLLDSGSAIGPNGDILRTRLVLRVDGSVQKSTAHKRGSLSWLDL